MMSVSVTRLLGELERGDPQAAAELLPLVYDELRQLAAWRLEHEPVGMTLQATALVHEAYLKLVGPQAAERPWEGRRHFFAAAAEAMRRILVDQARRRRRLKHGGEHHAVDLPIEVLPAPETPDDLLALDEALGDFARIDPIATELVKLRYFAGLTMSDAAEVLGLSTRTAERLWSFSRAWLFRALQPDEG
jgi:RNA polymerase sigma factor (TIGR02999 family)